MWLAEAVYVDGQGDGHGVLCNYKAVQYAMLKIKMQC
jgi:hypothetical protein